MMRRLEVRAVLACAMVWLAPAALAAAPEASVLSHGRFENVPVLRPQGEPQRVVIWFAGSGEQTQRRAEAEALRDDGAMVLLVDTAHLYAVLHKDPGSCVFSAGDVENFSRYVQAYYQVPTYRLPLLVGDGAGSALAYAVAAQAPDHVLAGVLTDGLCPQDVPGKAICGAGVNEHGRTLMPARLPVPWLAAESTARQCPKNAVAGFLKNVPQGRLLKRNDDGDLLPGLRAAARSLGARKGVSLPAPPADLAGLPVVEVPLDPPQPGDTFAIFVSGDGGWAGLDKNVAGALAQSGVPVVGVDSLRYFWSARTPAGFAADLDRIVRFYAHLWKRDKVVLIGFSQGADVLPAAINRLPEATRASVRATALLSVGRTADYEFHVSNWISSNDDGLPIAPEIARMPAAQTLCIYGEDDKDALCPDLPATAAERISLPGDHHFKGDYSTLAKVIIQHLPR